MGGIVKSIGKAIKGIGKAIKKILPILLVAAAVYVGYGYMTGFQAGGWPQITNWGKSLMAGAQTTALGAETAALGTEAVTTALPATEAATSTAIGLDGASTGMIGQAGADVASTGMIDGMGMPAGAEAAGPASNWALDSMAQTQTGIDTMYSEIGAGWKDMTQGVLDSLSSPAQAAGMGSDYGVPLYTQPAGSTYIPELGGASPAYPGVAESTSLSGVTDVASINQAAADQVMGTTPTTSYGESTGLPPQLGGPSSVELSVAETGIPAGAHTGDKSFMPKLMQLGRKAWNMYKQMWADNPGMAMWTTSNVLKTILAMLDDTDEKLAHRRAHVGGFAPGGYPELAGRYDGNLPGGRGGGAGYTAPRGRSGLIKTGPISEGNRGRSSAVDTRPAKEYGSTQQGQVS